MPNEPMTKQFTAKLCGHGCTFVPAADRRDPELSSLETETRDEDEIKVVVRQDGGCGGWGSETLQPLLLAE